MGAWRWLLQLRSRGTRGGEGWTNSCKLWPSPMCMRCPLGFPNPKSPLKSPQWAGTGGEIPGQICCWAVAGHAGTSRESHAHLPNLIAPVPDSVASLCPLMGHRNAKFRPSSFRSVGCLVERCTRGLDRAFCRGLPGEAAPCLVPLTPRNSFVVLGIHPPTLNFIPFRPSKNYSLQAIYSTNVAGTFCC